MTSEQTEALQRIHETAEAFIAACDNFVHAFGQDYPEQAELVGECGQYVAADMQDLDDEL